MYVYMHIYTRMHICIYRYIATPATIREIKPYQARVLVVFPFTYERMMHSMRCTPRWS